MSGATMISPMVRSGTNVQPRIEGDNVVAWYGAYNVRIYTNSSLNTIIQSNNWLKIRGLNGYNLMDAVGKNSLFWVFNSAGDDYCGVQSVSSGVNSYSAIETNKYQLLIMPKTGVTQFHRGGAVNSVVKITDSAAAVAIELNSTAGHVILLKDNAALKLGAGSDASFYYDGTNAFINPKLVGTGYLGVLGDIVQNDSVKHYFGTGLDASIYYDGTNMFIDPQVVGTGYLGINGSLMIGEGAAGVDYTLTFNGETNDGTITYKEDEDVFSFDTEVEIPATDAFYLGDAATDGSWRIIRSGNNLNFERRETGVWVSKGSFVP